MNWQPLRQAAAIAAPAALLLAVAMAGLDWWQNPAGIFHNHDGTNWAFVAETAASWFLPGFALLVILIMPFTCWRSRKKQAEM